MESLLFQKSNHLKMFYQHGKLHANAWVTWKEAQSILIPPMDLLNVALMGVA